MGSMGTEAGGTPVQLKAVLHTLHVLPIPLAWKQWDRLTGGQQDGVHQGTSAASASVLQWGAVSFHMELVQEGAPSNTPTAGFCVNWYLLDTEKSKGGENHVSPCTRHRDEEMHLIPMCGWAGSGSLCLYLAGREEMRRKSRKSKPRGKKTATGNLEVRYWPWKDWAGEGET